VTRRRPWHASASSSSSPTNPRTRCREWRALRETLGASSVLIDPASVLGLAPARSGAEPYEPMVERTLQHRGTRLGRLVIGARAPSESYGPADRALTDVLAHQVALEIADDGHGLAADAAPGVGLRSMHERAAELGGRVELATGPSGGLAVDVRLPCATAQTQ
jgi:hypothetical protein